MRLNELFIGYKAWKQEEYLLNRMSLADLRRAYITYPGIQVYLALIVLTLTGALFTLGSPLRFVLAMGASVVLYPAIWYVLHRWVLHNPLMYKSPLTAAVWKRTHYDHHRFPNDLSVLFGGLQTTLPTILIFTGPVGWLIGGLSGALASICSALIMTCVYEFWHCGQHLAFEPKSDFWKRIKKLHLAHHFHNEKGNFGITNFLVDEWLGTHYEEAEDMPRSATARNLGYTDQVAVKYPWVKELTDQEGKSRGGLRADIVGS
ncbi:MAG: sterol desaturase family protein [Pseudomonadota bacterium]